MSNPTGKGGFRDHPEHAVRLPRAELVRRGRAGGVRSGQARSARAAAQFADRAKRAVLDIRATLSPEDVDALADVICRAHRAGVALGYQRAWQQQKRARTGSEAA